MLHFEESYLLTRKYASKLVSHATGNVHCVQTQNIGIVSCVTVHVIASRKQLLIKTDYIHL